MPRPEKRLRAVAYYRHSAEIGQENSVEIQQDNIRAFAEKHGITIIREFADRGKSGLNAEGRPAFNEMMALVRSSQEFELVLVLDVSRWGRFQDTDLSAHYESLCTQHGKQVVYTQIGFGRDEDRLITQLRKSIDRYQSAEYSRALSKIKEFLGDDGRYAMGFVDDDPVLGTVAAYPLSRCILQRAHAAGLDAMVLAKASPIPPRARPGSAWRRRFRRSSPALRAEVGRPAAG
jgi:hypothetical protein